MVDDISKYNAYAEFTSIKAALTCYEAVTSNPKWNKEGIRLMRMDGNCFITQRQWDPETQKEHHDPLIEPLTGIKPLTGHEP